MSGTSVIPPERNSELHRGLGPHRHAPLWARLIATFFGMGNLRPGPGTWASAVTVFLWAVVAHFIRSDLRAPIAMAAAFVLLHVGIVASTVVARAWSLKDPQSVVIDEVVGQLIALIGVPLAWRFFLVGFILFRAFDIVKPPPVRQLEALPEGAGIVLDDVAAGFYALVVVHLLLHFGLLK